MWLRISCAYLLKLVHQVCRVIQDALVGRVQLLREDLVDNPVVAYIRNEIS